MHPSRDTSRSNWKLIFSFRHFFIHFLLFTMALLPGRFIRHFSLATTSSSSLFKSIVHSRKTCPRFLPEQTIEEPVLKDILETTLVRTGIGVAGAGASHIPNYPDIRLTCFQLTAITLEFQFTTNANNCGTGP